MKKTLFLILGSVFTLTLSSCGGTNPSESSAKPQKVYITWKDYDGTPLLNDIYDYGEMPSYKGVTPTRAKDAQFTYTFSGWSPEIVPATKDESYVAQYSTVTNRYSITWTNYDGTILSNETYEYGEMPDYKGKTPTRTKDVQYTYSFSGWSPSISKVTGDATYKANYSKELNKYVVSWRNFDGSLLFDETYEYGAIPSFKEEPPFKPRDEQYTYSFSGWSPSITKVVCDTSYTAQFSETINTYEITWANYNGDILSVETYEYGQLPSYKGDTPTRPKDDHYYFFDGWTDTVVSVTCNKTYTAKYVYGYLITWQNYNGDVLETDIVKKGDTPVYAGSIPEKPVDNTYYYNFSKWSPEITAASSDTTYTATFDSNDILTFQAKSSSYLISKCNYTDIENLVIPSTYRGFPVDEIGTSAFKDCKKLETIVIPDSVISIGTSAFEGCNSLKSMTLPFVGENKNATSSSKSTLFGFIFSAAKSYSITGIRQRYGSGFAYYDIPKSLRTIRITGGNLLYGAFSGCSSLTSITIPNGVTSIGSYAFESCSSLTSITIPENVTSIGASTFSGCSSLTSITIPESVTSLGNYSFSGCSSLTSITIPQGVTSIGDYAFSSCSSLTSITIPQGVTSIGSYAFSNCSSLVSMTIPEGVTSIDSYAFEKCLSLKDIVIGKSAIKYGSYIFDKCESLKSITLPFSSNEDDQTYMDKFFRQYSVSSKFTQIRGYYTNYYVPKSLDTIIVNDGLISDYAFYGLSVINTISIESDVTSIGKQAFYNCSHLINLNLPNTVVSIGQDAFKGCAMLSDLSLNNSEYKVIDGVFYSSDLTKLIQCLPGKVSLHNIPSSVTTICDNAFDGCSSLVSLTIPGTVTSIGDSAFSGCSSLQSITLQYIGNNINASQSSKESLFGAIFGSKEYNGGKKVTQYYVTSTGDKVNCVYYIPSSLRTVVITGGKVFAGAFSGCTMLEHVVIKDEIEIIENNSFSGCSSLQSITLPFIGTNKYATGPSPETLFGSIFEVDTSSSSRSTEQCYEYGKSEKFLIPQSLRSITVTGGSVFFGTFYNCNYLTTVELKNDVQLIGDQVFYNCSSLTSITIPDGVTSIGYRTFYNCSSLTSITIPDGVTSIDDQAFYNCSSLASVALSEGVNSIGNQAFSGCSSLTSITIPDGVTSIDDQAFSGCSSLTSVTIPGSVTSIGSKAFYNCSSLTSITIPDGVTSIDDQAFYNCSSLSSITIPDGVTSIGEYAFSNCSSLTSVTIPGSVKSISSNAFSFCTSLTSITISEGVTSIGKYAFHSCSSLSSIIIPDSVTSIGSGAFYYCLSLTSVTILGSVKSIGSQAFMSCSSLTSITIADGVTSIDSYAFYGCSSLTSITIPDGVTSIGYEAFLGCSSLTSITIPDGVTSIDDRVFYNCSSLETIVFGKNLSSISMNAFSGDLSSLHEIVVSSENQYFKVANNALYNYELTELIYVFRKDISSIIIPSSVTTIRNNAVPASIEIIYYSGTPSEWLAIGSNISLDKVYFYSETAPTDDGNYWRYVNGVPQIWEASKN